MRCNRRDKSRGCAGLEDGQQLRPHHRRYAARRRTERRDERGKRLQVSPLPVEPTSKQLLDCAVIEQLEDVAVELVIQPVRSHLTWLNVDGVVQGYALPVKNPLHGRKTTSL